MLANCQDAVLATGGVESAVLAEEGADELLVSANKGDRQPTERADGAARLICCGI